MDPARAMIGDLVGVLLAGLIAAIVARRRYRLCWSFLAYVVAVFVGDRLTRSWPGTFDTPEWWTLKESVYGWLKVVIVAEIGMLTFARLERAQRLLWGILTTFVALGVLAQLAPVATTAASAVIPWASLARGQATVLCLLAAVAVLAAHYHVPVHPFHRGILMGFVLYLLAYSGAIAVMRELGAPSYRTFLALDPTAYAATVGLWVWTAWRSDPVATPAARALQPWAAST
jgi:hypothetical protein